MKYQPKVRQSFRRLCIATLGSLGLSSVFLTHCAEAQTPVTSTLRRQSGGWQPTTKPAFAPSSQVGPSTLLKTALAPARTADETSPLHSPIAQPETRERSTDTAVQTAYFQAQGSLSDGLPVLPTAGQELSAQGYPGPANSGQGYAGQGYANGGGVLPPFPGANGAPNSVIPPAENIAPPQLPMRTGLEGANYPPSELANGGAAGRPASSDLRTIQNSRLQSNSNQTPANNNQTSASSNQPPANSNQLLGSGRADQMQRDIGAASDSQAQTGRLSAEGFTSGLPFVTPAARGRYATSPYQPAVFQSAEYRPMGVPAQLASNTNASGASYVAPQPTLLTSAGVQTANPVAGGTTPTYLTALQAPLPQYRYAQPGVYPTAYQCTTPAPSVPSTGAVPGNYIPPTLPPNLTPNLYTPNNSGYTPFFSLGQENYNVQLGRGIIGQPTVYVPGQPIRNFMRYLSP